MQKAVEEIGKHKTQQLFCRCRIFFTIFSTKESTKFSQHFFHFMTICMKILLLLGIFFIIDIFRGKWRKKMKMRWWIILEYFFHYENFYLRHQSLSFYNRLTFFSKSIFTFYFKTFLHCWNFPPHITPHSKFYFTICIKWHSFVIQTC